MTSILATPEVTIGLPVYNGEAHLRTALDSLLEQTFSDFELLISDNASVDRTEQICAEYAQRDARISYFRQPHNLGATENWNFVVRHARGKYFKWATANDICPPGVLERSVEVLRNQPEVVLCYGNTTLIDESGRVIGQYTEDPEVMDASPSVRFIRILNELIRNNAQCGLIRTDALRRTGLDRHYLDGDMVLMAELALLGGYRKLDEVFLLRREGKTSASVQLTEAERRHFLRPNASAHTIPVLQLHADRFLSVLRAPIPGSEKRRTLIYVVKSVYWDRSNIWRGLLNFIRSFAPISKRAGAGASG